VIVRSDYDERKLTFCLCCKIYHILHIHVA